MCQQASANYPDADFTTARSIATYCHAKYCVHSQYIARIRFVELVARHVLAIRDVLDFFLKNVGVV